MAETPETQPNVAARPAADEPAPAKKTARKRTRKASAASRVRTRQVRVMWPHTEFTFGNGNRALTVTSQGTDVPTDRLDDLRTAADAAGVRLTEEH